MIEGSEIILYNTIMVHICHYMFFKAHTIFTPRVNPNVNYGLCVTIMYQYRLVDYNKYATLAMLVWDVGQWGKFCM
jgi:hypothetical protein